MGIDRPRPPRTDLMSGDVDGGFGRSVQVGAPRPESGAVSPRPSARPALTAGEHQTQRFQVAVGDGAAERVEHGGNEVDDRDGVFADDLRDRRRVAVRAGCGEERGGLRR